MRVALFLRLADCPGAPVRIDFHGGDHCTEMPGNKFGNPPCPSSVLPSNPGGTLSVQHARPTRGIRTSMRRVPEVHLLSMEPRSWSRPGLLSFGVPACVCPRPVGLPTWGVGKGCWGSGRTFAKCRTTSPRSRPGHGAVTDLQLTANFPSSAACPGTHFGTLRKCPGWSLLANRFPFLPLDLRPL